MKKQKFSELFDERILKHIYVDSWNADERVWKFLSDCVAAGIVVCLTQFVLNKYLPEVVKTALMFILGLIFLATAIGSRHDDDEFIE